MRWFSDSSSTLSEREKSRNRVCWHAPSGPRVRETGQLAESGPVTMHRAGHGSVPQKDGLTGSLTPC